MKRSTTARALREWDLMRKQHCACVWTAKTKDWPLGGFPGGPGIKTSWVLGLIPGQETRSHLLQPSSHSTLKILCATAKTQHSQTPKNQENKHQRLPLKTKQLITQVLSGYGKIGTLIHGWWDCKRISTLENSRQFLKKLNILLPHNPTIPLLGFTQEKQSHTYIQRLVHECSRKLYVTAERTKDLDAA